MMLSSRGFILVTTLILMLVLSCITLPVLVQTHLSQKMTGSATSYFQLKQQTKSTHLLQLQQIKAGSAESASFVVAPCPALYAAWSNLSMECKWYHIHTTEQVGRQQHSISSILIKLDLPKGAWNEDL